MKPERWLATVLFTDIVGSTEKAAELGDRRWPELLEVHHAIARHELAHFGGRELNMTGDGFLATFDVPERASGDNPQRRAAAGVRDPERPPEAWRDAGPELQPMAEEARAAARRLTSFVKVIRKL